jgi:valyl-tRNA synthetase
MPFVTEEVWSWWHDDSIHLAAWPQASDVAPTSTPSRIGFTYASVGDVLEAIRREKSTAKVSQRAEVERLVVSGPADFLDAVKSGESDLRDAGTVAFIDYVETSDVSVVVTLSNQ